MAGIDYTTVVINRGKWIHDIYIPRDGEAEDIYIPARLMVEGHVIDASRYSVYIDNRPAENWIAAHRRLIHGYEKTKLKTFTDNEDDEPLYAVSFRLNTHHVCIFPESKALGGATYVYVIDPHTDDIGVIATGYGHYQNPHLHFINRGLSDKAEAEIVGNLWEAMTSDWFTSDGIFGDMDFSAEINPDYRITAPSLVALHNRFEELDKRRSKRWQIEAKLKRIDREREESI